MARRWRWCAGDEWRVEDLKSDGDVVDFISEVVFEIANVYRLPQRHAIRHFDVSEARITLNYTTAYFGQIEEFDLPGTIVSPNTAGYETKWIVKKRRNCIIRLLH